MQGGFRFLRRIRARETKAKLPVILNAWVQATRHAQCEALAGQLDAVQREREKESQRWGKKDVAQHEQIVALEAEKQVTLMDSCG